MHQARIERVLFAMQNKGLEQMILCDRDSIWYLTGYDVWAGERMYVFYLRADGLKQKEIAQRLGYTNHSAVGQRLSKLQEKCHAFLASNNEISDKTFKA